MKKLLITTDAFLPRWDGIARFISNIIPTLQDTYQITIVCPAFKGNVPNIEGVKIVRFPTIPLRFGDITFASWNYARVKQLVRQHDVVFNHSLGPLGMSAITAAKKLKKPVVSFVHSLEWELTSKSVKHCKTLAWGAMKLMTRWFYNKCSLLLVPSQELADILSLNGIQTKKQVVELGVDVAKFIPPVSRSEAKRAIGVSREVNVITYVGRIAREKNLETLYHAFEKIRKEVKNTILLIVGEGLSDEIRPSSRVLMVGKQDNPVPYYQASDIYVLPSLTETTSLATLEAMATGCAVVVTPVGSIREYIQDGVNGIIFPRRDVQTLADTLMFLLTHPKTREALGQEARKTVEKRSWQASAVAIKQALGSV
ncbi:glycosyltransferase family 4 protein [Candidatus Woesearchaeota archaeon]|nr:glycosyltransferase family 4 protein [Candidatus Woesearchaeota archaeon]